LFANDLRNDSAVAGLGFVEIAKEVGRRWQALDHDSKQKWELQAAQALEEYQRELEAYKATAAYESHQTYVRDFRKNEAERQQLLRASRTASTPIKRQRYNSISSSGEISDSDLASDLVEAPPEDCQNALASATSQIHELQNDYEDLQCFTGESLPPEHVIRHATAALMDGTGSFLYMWNQQDLSEAVDRLYVDESYADPLTLVEVFVSAAIGSHYESQLASEQLRHSLYKSAVVHFSGIGNRDYHRIMRILLCFSFFSIFEKHLGARKFICMSARL